jgi:hypothetical protein
MEKGHRGQNQGFIEPVIAYSLLAPHQGLEQENGELNTVINGIKNCPLFFWLGHADPALIT